MFKVVWVILLKLCLKVHGCFASSEPYAAAKSVNEMQKLEVDKFRLEWSQDRFWSWWVLGCSSRKCLFGPGCCSMASMAHVRQSQNSPSWLKGNYESRNSSTAGLNRAAAPCAFLDNSASMLNAIGQKSYLWVWKERPEDLEPRRTSLSSSFPAFVGGQVQTDPSCPAQAPVKACLASIAHLEKALLHAGASLHYPALGWTQCWAALNTALGCLQSRAGSCRASLEHGQKTSAVCIHLPKQVLNWP